VSSIFESTNPFAQPPTASFSVEINESTGIPASIFIKFACEKWMD
jgi:hypothetical protein